VGKGSRDESAFRRDLWMKWWIFVLFTLLTISEGVFAQNDSCRGPYLGHKFTQSALDIVLTKHKSWLADRHALASQFANFCGSNLNGLNLRGASLAKVDLYGADLSEADLRGVDFTDANLKKVYFRWSNLEGADFTRAALQDASLQETNLHEANFEQAKMVGANLSDAVITNASLRGANLEGANFSHSDLSESDLAWSILLRAKLVDAKLMNVDFSHAQLVRADFEESDLNGSNFSFADLSFANLFMTRLKSVNFTSANLFKTIYQPVLGQLPNIISLVSSDNFETIQFHDYQIGAPTVAELRNAYKSVGMRPMEREITSMLKYEEMKQAWSRGGTGYIESGLGFIFFYLTSDYGATPGRPLRIFLLMIFLFSFPYYYAMRRGSKHAGIIIFWEPRRFYDWKLTHETPDFRQMQMLLRPKSLRSNLYLMALFFSLLSSFQIGWRDLNVGSWISRLQPREFSLRGIGWVRVLAGSQALISAYLIVLWALTYFGRPFEW